MEALFDQPLPSDPLHLPSPSSVCWWGWGTMWVDFFVSWLWCGPWEEILSKLVGARIVYERILRGALSCRLVDWLQYLPQRG